MLLTIVLAGTAFILLTQDVKYVFPFYAIFGNLSLGMFVLLKDWKNKINLSYAATALLTALWAMLILFYGLANTPAEALLWSKIAAGVYAYIPIPFIYFFSVFPKEDVVPKRYQMIAWFCVATFFALISFTDLIIKDILRLKEGFVFIPGPAFALFVVYFLGFLVFAFSRLIERYYAYRGLNRRQIVYVLLGFFLGFIFPVITNLVLPLFGYSLLAGVGPFSTVITVGFISYAITKSRLMDISVIISRAVAEVIAVLFLGLIYLGLVWLHWTYISTSITFTFIAITVLYGILVGQIHQRIRLFIQTTSDKLFLHGKYDYYKELSEASMKVGEKLSLASILQILYRTFHDVVEISNPRIFLPENFSRAEATSKRYVVFDEETASAKQSGEEIRIDDQLVKQLILTRAPVLFPHDPKRELVVPCLLEDRLIAIFVLGRKLSEDHYTDDDIQLLMVLASQAAITLDHTRSYEKIRAELEVAERQLSRSQRLASLGTLTAGVTHEIRNPLTVIRSETDRLPSRERDLAYLKNHRDLVLRHVDRIAAIIQRMLRMAKEKPRQEEEVDLNEAIISSLQLVAISAVNLKKDLELVPLIKGDKIELEEIFVNLFQNAIQAMPEGGTLTIRTYIDEGRAVAEVTDTGNGIPPQIMEKIFDPFFSSRHEGVGLGLSIAYRIIREHGGDIRVKSEEGKGTTFKILF
ncbi:MAG: ATP-binding protein [Candidatus Margulisiibacteriota bacterium]